jgi:hypothetical protein
MLPPPRWDHAVIKGHKGQNSELECKYCGGAFRGGASRIREHFIRWNSSVGVKACTAAAEEIEDVVAEMNVGPVRGLGVQKRQERQNSKRTQKRMIWPDFKNTV